MIHPSTLFFFSCLFYKNWWSSQKTLIIPAFQCLAFKSKQIEWQMSVFHKIPKRILFSFPLSKMHFWLFYVGSNIKVFGHHNDLNIGNGGVDRLLDETST